MTLKIDRKKFFTGQLILFTSLSCSPDSSGLTGEVLTMKLLESLSEKVLFSFSDNKIGWTVDTTGGNKNVRESMTINDFISENVLAGIFVKQ